MCAQRIAKDTRKKAKRVAGARKGETKGPKKLAKERQTGVPRLPKNDKMTNDAFGGKP